jgi:hypothetical protein
VTAIAIAAALAACGDGAGDGGQPHVVSAQPLPSSLKGYELYAWDEGPAPRFTLITGTNREKTLDEITRKNVDIRQDGFALINSSGWDDLQRVLALVPRGTPVVFGPSVAGLPALGAPSRGRIMQMLQAIAP